MVDDIRTRYTIPKLTEFVIDLSIIRGIDLVAKDKKMFIGPNVSSDPYVLVYYGGKEKYKTKVIYKTLNPTWNEKFRINVGANDGIRALKGHTDYTQLILHIFDRDKFSSDDFMGESVVPLPLIELLTENSTTILYRVGAGSGELRCANAMGKIEVKMKVSETKGLNMEVGTMYIIPRRIQVALRRDINGAQTTIDNSCIAVDKFGHILLNESVYCGNLTNSNTSIRSSGNMHVGETVFSCNLNWVPLRVRAFYFIFTIIAPDETLKDLKSMMVKVRDEICSKPLYHWTPNISGKHTDMILIRITRDYHCWNVSLIENVDHIPKDLKTLILNSKGFSCDTNPKIKLNPKERIAMMRLDRSISIKDYANDIGADQKLVLGFGWERMDGRNDDFNVSAICLDANLNVVEVISYVNHCAFNGSIRHGGDKCTSDGNKDNEEISINLGTVNSSIMHVGFVINLRYGHELDRIEKAKWYLFDVGTKRNLASCQISDNLRLKQYTGLMVACLCRGSEDWILRNTEKPTLFGNSIHDLKNFFLNASALDPTADPKPEIILKREKLALFGNSAHDFKNFFLDASALEPNVVPKPGIILNQLPVA